MEKRPKILTNSFGQAGGGWPPPQSGQPDRFFTVFFLPLPLLYYNNNHYVIKAHLIGNLARISDYLSLLQLLKLYQRIYRSMSACQIISHHLMICDSCKLPVTTSAWPWLDQSRLMVLWTDGPMDQSRPTIFSENCNNILCVRNDPRNGLIRKSMQCKSLSITG